MLVGDIMNTYFNEITSKPINTVDGKVLYKIPAGAMCGNGDIGVVFDKDEKDLVKVLENHEFVTLKGKRAIKNKTIAIIFFTSAL